MRNMAWLLFTEFAQIDTEEVKEVQQKEKVWQERA